MVIACVIILIPNAPLIAITLWTQDINAMLLPVVLISMQLMVNNPEIMGEHVNNKLQNAVGWSTTVILITLHAAFACHTRDSISSKRIKAICFKG